MSVIREYKIRSTPGIKIFSGEHGIDELNEYVRKMTPESEEPKMKAMSTLEDTKTAIKYKGFIVGSFTQRDGMSVAANPVVHANLNTARAEARRLATQFPDKLFTIIQLVGGEYCPPVPQTVSL